MEALIVLFFLFLIPSLGNGKKKAQQKREAEQRVFRQMQEDVYKRQTTSWGHFCLD